jgi:hypothetical protein
VAAVVAAWPCFRVSPLALQQQLSIQHINMVLPDLNFSPPVDEQMEVADEQDVRVDDAMDDEDDQETGTNKFS